MIIFRKYNREKTKVLNNFADKAIDKVVSRIHEIKANAVRLPSFVIHIAHYKVSNTFFVALGNAFTHPADEAQGMWGSRFGQNEPECPLKPYGALFVIVRCQGTSFVCYRDAPMVSPPVRGCSISEWNGSWRSLSSVKGEGTHIGVFVPLIVSCGAGQRGSFRAITSSQTKATADLSVRYSLITMTRVQLWGPHAAQSSRV